MEIRNIIAENLSALRTEAGLTQLQLAAILNYSDKAISKWERAESIPDIFMLKQIADYYGVTVDYLLTRDHTDCMVNDLKKKPLPVKNRVIISFLALSLVWLIATFLFVAFNIVDPEAQLPAFMMFIYAIPVSAVVALVFNSIWGIGKLNYIIITLLLWSLILSAYMTVLMLTVHNIWMIFLLGVPAQIIILLWSGFSIIKPRKKEGGKA